MGKEEDLQHYLHLFSQMGRASVGGFHAPHKPVLLLSIQYLIQTGWQTDNHVVLDKVLIDTFKQFWRIKVDDGSFRNYVVCEDLIVPAQKPYPFRCFIANPYYYMGNEPFWKLVKSDRWEKRCSYSVKQLSQFYEYAEIDQALFDLMYIEPYASKITNYLESLI